MREKIAQLATRVGEQPPAPVLIVGHLGNGQREGHSQFLISYAGYWYGDFLFGLRHHLRRSVIDISKIRREAF